MTRNIDQLMVNTRHFSAPAHFLSSHCCLFRKFVTTITHHEASILRWNCAPFTVTLICWTVGPSGNIIRTVMSNCWRRWIRLLRWFISLWKRNTMRMRSLGLWRAATETGTVQWQVDGWLHRPRADWCWLASLLCWGLCCSLVARHVAGALAPTRRRRSVMHIERCRTCARIRSGWPSIATCYGHVQRPNSLFWERMIVLQPGILWEAHQPATSRVKGFFYEVPVMGQLLIHQRVIKKQPPGDGIKYAKMVADVSCCMRGGWRCW